MEPLLLQDDVVFVANFVATFVVQCIGFRRPNDFLESEMLAHEKLHVYGKALGFVAAATAFSAAWDKRHAVVDQFGRASESLILNLADGARLRSGPNKLRALEWMEWFVSLPGGKDLSCLLERGIDEGATSIVLNIAEGHGRYSELDHRRFLDVAEGSAVKVAAYLDLAVQRRTLGQAACGPGRKLLGRIVAMLSRM
mgnify:CR=1 FL=1